MASVLTGEAAGWLSARLQRSEKRIQERARKMAGLVDATMALATCQEPEELGRLTALGGVEVYEAAGSLVLLQHPAGALAPVGDEAWSAEARQALEKPEGQEILELLLGAPDLQPAEELLAELAALTGYASLQVLPLCGSGEPVGLLLVGFEGATPAPDQFTAYVGRTLATQAGLGFERVASAKELLEASLHDPLTGLGNRRGAMQALAGLEAGDSVVIIDLDHFKQVNDSYGHAAGDRVLRALGEFLRSSVREPDQVFRFGGEEFLLILSGGGAGARCAVERIHARWSRQERVTTFSAGLAVHDGRSEPERTVDRADRALYAAKRGGRNRVVACGTEGR